MCSLKTCFYFSISNDLFIHAALLDQVLEAHGRTGIMIKQSKTFLFQKYVHYLGHDLSAAGISMIDEYVQKIVNWQAPTTGKDLASCLGFFSYYGVFLPDYSTFTSDVNTQKYNHTVVWSDKMVKDFQTLKDAFAKAPIHEAPDFDIGENLFSLPTIPRKLWAGSSAKCNRDRNV